jgi:hypothetical protein
VNEKLFDVLKSMTTLMCKAIRLIRSQIDTASRFMTAVVYQAISLVFARMSFNILFEVLRYSAGVLHARSAYYELP